MTATALKAKPPLRGETLAQPLPLTARGLSKAYGGRSVIDGLDLHIPAGQFLAIVGRSGCGKSTLLRLLAGLETPDGGSIRHGSREIGRAGIRLMFQEPRLLPWASVIANVEIGLGEGVGSEARGRAATALADVGLADRATQWPSTLSGGQKQRVALARALVSRPGILAFDEPLGALDALTRIEMQTLLETIFLERPFTGILVTHDVNEALALADRLIVLENGRIGLDIDIPLPRPRRRGSPEAAAIEAEVLDRLLSPGGRDLQTKA